MVDLGPATSAQYVARELAKLLMVAYERDVCVWYMESNGDYQVYDERTDERIDVTPVQIKGRLAWVAEDAGE